MQGLDMLMEFLNKLEHNKIFYELKKVRDNSIMASVSVPGQRWEVEFMTDGTVEIEKFCSNGEIFGENELKVLFNDFSD